MEKKVKTQVAVNESSGAKKVERIEKSKTQKTLKKETPSTAIGDAAMGTGKSVNAKSTNGKAERESLAAKSRVEAALKRKEAQQKRKEERQKRAKERAEKRKAQLSAKKAEMEKRLAEYKEKMKKRKAAREEAARERAHQKANRRAAAARKRAAARKKREEERGKRQGYGGWLAAVVSLGVVTLALTTAVTVGGMELGKIKKGAISSHRATMYELTGIMEHVDDNLDRIRVSASPVQQSRILTDLLVQTRLAELDLEKLPIKAEQDVNITSFINRTASECERMLAKLRKGENLSTEDMARLERLYQVNHIMMEELEDLTKELDDETLTEFIKKGMGNMRDAFDRLEKLTLEENHAAKEGMKNKMEEAGASRNTPALPKKERTNGIDPARAEELCSVYFSEYAIGQFQCTGETVTRDYTAYNVQGYDEKGTLLFAEISQNDGALLRFDYFEDCVSETFDLKNAARIANEFLDKLGYTNMETVRLRESGTTTDFTYVYAQNGVAYYPDEIRVKVCRSRGVVTGLDSTKYLKNHTTREEPNAKITLEEAYEKLHKGLEVESARLAVIKTGKREQAAYELLCSYGKEMYWIYLSADTGEELSIVNAKALG